MPLALYTGAVGVANYF